MPARSQVYFTCSSFRSMPWEGPSYVERIKQEFLELKQDNYGLSENGETADFILFLEPNRFKGRSYTEIILREPLVRAFPNKCFTANYDAAPIPQLPGVYTSMPRKFFDDKRFRAGGYLSDPNPLCKEVAHEKGKAKTLIASFRGFRTAGVRADLLEAGKHWPSGYSVVETFEWFNHSPAVQRTFAEEIQKSCFAICPRGLATSSYRLYEAMELGTAPVILSDEWVPPVGPDWGAFSVRLAEQKVKDLPDILESMRDKAGEMGSLARAAWEKHFSPGNRLIGVLNSLKEIQLTRDTEEAAHHKLWKTWSFYTPHKLHPAQGILRRISRKLGIKQQKGPVHPLWKPGT